MKDSETAKDVLEDIEELVKIKREIYTAICVITFTFISFPPSQPSSHNSLHFFPQDKLLKMCEAALHEGKDTVNVKAEILYRILHERTRLLSHFSSGSDV